MCYFQDHNAYQMCLLHSMACYLIVGGGSRHRHRVDPEKKFIFPFLAILSQSSGGAAKAMSKYLSDLVKAKSVPGLYEDTTATFLRIGSTNTMVNHPTTSLTDAIRRGGWDFTGICNKWEYILQLSESLAIAGRALAGYPNKVCAMIGVHA